MIHHIFTKISSDFDFFEEKGIISYVNVYNYIQLRKSPYLVKSINYFTLDGILLVVLVRILFFKKIKRLSPDFSSYFEELFHLCEQKDKKVYFIGASQKEIQKFILVINEKHPRLNIVGSSNGFFQQEKAETIIDRINILAPDLVFVGLGTPKQEEFAVQLIGTQFNKTVYTCGAFISQTAKKGVRYYPKFINKLHLRWFYRLLMEKGLFKRYFILYPLSVFLIIKDFLNKKDR
ncbi:MAG: WecB/TagA/CpsF family glycosyltransferase [Anaerolineae bacterium]|nr:WecB/TagA/CpsF family glycosyltransferase [Anaerolineae bacterium]